MMFKKDIPLYSYEVVNESGEKVMYINYLGANIVPSLVDYSEVMARTIDNLSENHGVSRVVFVQQRNYSYDFNQVRMLFEIVSLYNYFIKQERILSQDKLSFAGENISQVYDQINGLINILLKQDPVRAYRELKGLYFVEKSLVGKNQGSVFYIKFLENLIEHFDGLEVIRKLKPFFDSYSVDDRQIYSEIFRPDVMPNFTFTRMISKVPDDAEICQQYDIANDYDKSTVTIFKQKNKLKMFYHLSPPEYSLNEDHHLLLNLARQVLIEHKPTSDEFSDPGRTRQVFFNVARDLVQDLANSKHVSLSYADLNKLATILVRYTIGFGIIEVLLQDESLQDLLLNAPAGMSPIFVRHNEYGECVTNLVVSQEDVESWAAKFRMLSGRPLDEANPILDTNLVLENAKARVAIVQNPLSPSGTAYALRRHRNKPWTLALFIKNKMISGLGAGLLSFIVEGSRTILVAGTRSSGKTSLLGSLMLEIMPKYRVITVEDTLELPVSDLKKLGYDILSMKVRSALTRGETTEVAASEGIRASLRLGDSGLIVGEIRSEEAKALYEAMRVGALANVVAGTIHGSSPYSVFDRVVNDLGIPVTSFKATDCIIAANPIKSPDGIHSWRRVLQIAEVRKKWTKDPLVEGGFVDLMKYNVEKDLLEPSDDLINGDSEVLKDIASNVKGWAGDWDAVWDNVVLRQKIKEETVRFAEKLKKPEILEAEFNVLSSNAFHQISDKIIEEVGLPVSDRVFPEWKNWLEKEARRLDL